MPLSTIFHLYPVSLIGGGNRSTRRKTTDLSQVTDKLYHIMLNQIHLALEGFKLTTLVAIVIDCINSCIFNYHTITTTTHTHPALGKAEKMYKKSINCHKFLIHQSILYQFLLYNGRQLHQWKIYITCRTPTERQTLSHYVVLGVGINFKTLVVIDSDYISKLNYHMIKFFIDMKSNKGSSSATIQSTDIHKT